MKKIVALTLFLARPLEATEYEHASELVGAPESLSVDIDRPDLFPSGFIATIGISLNNVVLSEAVVDGLRDIYAQKENDLHKKNGIPFLPVQVLDDLPLESVFNPETLTWIKEQYPLVWGLNLHDYGASDVVPNKILPILG